jgi:hypothetical protein
MVFHSNQTRPSLESIMPDDRLPARSLISHAATAFRSISLDAHANRLPAVVRRFFALIGLSGSLVLLVGVAVALLCTVLAIQLAVPYPIALLAGYITVVASVCVCAALVAVRCSVAKTEPIVESPEPNYEAWKLVGKLRVADASRLWCGIEPGHHTTPEVMAWASAILDAIERGELAKCESTGPLAQYKIGWHTEIQRDALQTWAKLKGHSPRFLRD